MPYSFREVERFFHGFHLETNCFLTEILQEAGPHTDSAGPQSLAAKRMLKRIRSRYKKLPPEFRRKDASNPVSIVTEVASRGLQTLEQSVVKKLQEAAAKKCDEKRAQLLFSDIAASLQSMCLAIKACLLLLKQLSNAKP
jgi:hypothetical protein